MKVPVSEIVSCNIKGSKIEEKEKEKRKRESRKNNRDKYALFV